MDIVLFTLESHNSNCRIFIKMLWIIMQFIDVLTINALLHLISFSINLMRYSLWTPLSCIWYCKLFTSSSSPAAFTRKYHKPPLKNKYIYIKSTALKSPHASIYFYQGLRFSKLPSLQLFFQFWFCIILNFKVKFLKTSEADFLILE